MDKSPLGAARVRRRLTIEEVAARADLLPEDVEALEEGRIYRFPSVADAVRAVLLYATALGISEREARRLAGLPVGRRLVEEWSPRRWIAAAAFAAACAGLLWFAARAELTPSEVAAPAVSAAGASSLPQPWEIEVDVYDGSRTANAATHVANRVAGLAYRIGNVGNADRSDYLETRVYYAPGGEAIAERLATELGVKTAALPGGRNARRLVVIVGARPAAA